MHDENHHKDPLERLFFKKAAEYEIPFREDDWLRLEKELDILDLQRSYRKKVGFLAAASILILATFGYFTFDNYNRLNRISDQLDTEPVPDTRSDNLPMEPLDPTTLLNQNQPSVTDRDPSIDDLEPTPTFNASSSQNIEAQSVASTNQLSESGQMEHQIVKSELLNVSLSDLHHTSNFNKVFAPADTFDSNINESLAIHDPIYSTHSDFDISDHVKSSRLGFGLALSPDKSSVNTLSQFYDTGYRIGVKGEYRLTDNLYLTAGVMASNVHYTTSGNRYNPPDYWNRGITPDRTTAICMILDIPLGLKYNVINFDGSRLFTTVGLSSYIMLNEDYRFDYYSDVDGLEENYVVKNGSRHLLNNIGLSVGYELDLYSNWSLRAEPFIN
ncbi:MAG: outer membrane beta-barrel protein, partial [Balneolaceae bacterium]